MNHLLKNLKAVLNTATLRQSSITFTGTIVNGILGALFYILAARYLGPSSFGTLIVAITTLTLVGDVGDLGTDTGLVRFVGRYRTKNKEKAFRFLKLALKVKLVVSFVVLGVGLLFAPAIASGIFGKPELDIPLRIASIGVGTYLLFSYSIRAIQAYERFWIWSVLQIVANAIRLLLVFLFVAIASISVSNVLVSYVAVPLVGFLVALFFLPRGMWKVKDESSVYREFFHYNKWVALFAVIAAVSSRLDTFISARMLSSTDVGVYSAANQLVQIVPQIIGAIGTVVAPKMASMGTIPHFVGYLKRTQLLVLGIAGMGILAIPAVLYIIPLLFGDNYAASGPLFIVLLIAMLIFLIALPVHMAVFYYFSYPRLFVWLALGHLIIIGLGGWYLIGLYGAMGAATTVLLGQLFNFLIPAVWVLKRISNSQLQTVNR